MLWYLKLESVKERYTKDLCEKWMPDAFEKAGMEYTPIEGTITRDDIGVGHVLDAAGRPIYALTQVAALITRIDEIQDGDIIYLQDFFTPGIEGLFYALDQYKKRVDVFAMQHAGCFDKHDFTYPMRHWMSHYELLLSKYLSGLFVASEVHKDLLQTAGYHCPIHVVSLPFSKKHARVRKKAGTQILDEGNRLSNRKGTVIYTSRLDPEKNPLFMLDVADKYLGGKAYRRWIITTSSDKLRAGQDVLMEIDRLKYKFSDQFIVKVGLTKDQYYAEMIAAQIQFNSAAQDFVSWTLLEATYCDCIPVYPNYRSFPEILPPDALYWPETVHSAVAQLCAAEKKDAADYRYLTHISDKGRLRIPLIMREEPAFTSTVWEELL